MAKVNTGAAPTNRRGSAEAIEKRRAGRRFNDVLTGRTGGRPALDGRTEKRRQRLLLELEQGSTRGNRPLKPLDVLLRVDELLSLGESLSSIRKVAKARKSGYSTDSIIEAVGQLHTAYHFRPETYRFVGIGEDVLRSAGVVAAKPRAKARAKPRRSSGA